MQAIKLDHVALISLCATWFVFGGLHLTKWDGAFITVYEKEAWRAASFLLTISPLLIILGKCCTSVLKFIFCRSQLVTVLADLLDCAVLAGALLFAGACRLALVSLMLSDLRSLHCSVYEAIDWTAFFPHS